MPARSSRPGACRSTASRAVIAERGRYDAADAATGFVRLWLPQ
jgi:hypothetical protein